MCVTKGGEGVGMVEEEPWWLKVTARCLLLCVRHQARRSMQSCRFSWLKKNDELRMAWVQLVSYRHLTLPTNREV